jgi:AcrR family transcriptional regulator
MRRSAEPPDPPRRERTRTALREAALARFVRDGFDATSIDDIAADVGVTARTFYRYFANKDEVLFADYEDRLDWFHRALSVRPRREPLVDSVRAAIDSFPDDPAVVAEIARLRTEGLDPERIEPHIRRVEARLAGEIEAHLLRRRPDAAGRDAGGPGSDEPGPDVADPDVRLRTAVVARAVAAAVFAALDTWMVGPADDLDELSRLTGVALDTVSPIVDT